MKQCGLFFLILISLPSCKGQVKTNLPKDSVSVSAGQVKLIKTLGTNQYNNVGCELQDKAGNLWFGTKGEGLYCYDGKSFTNFTEKDGLSSNFIWSMIEDKTGKLWFATADGISCYDPSASLLPGEKKFIIIPISAITGGTPNRKTMPDSYGMPHPEENSVWTILQDKKGMFWFGTVNGIYRYDGVKYSHFLENDGVINNTGVTINKGNAFGVERILEDKNGNIWFGGRGTEGILCFDGKTLTGFKPNGNHWLWPLLQDKAGNIWFSSWWGVCKYDGKSFVNLTKKDGLCFNNTTCILEDKNGNIWIGSDGEDGGGSDAPNGGLCRFDGTSYTHFTTKDGLTHNSVWSLIEDKTGNIWVGTRNTGLCRYDGKTFIRFTDNGPP
jgi:ligand-binding sensor domain-containing protein